jgi:hypothetical protein
LINLGDHVQRAVAILQPVFHAVDPVKAPDAKLDALGQRLPLHPVERPRQPRSPPSSAASNVLTTT